MQTFSWPALAGLCFLLNASFVHSATDPAVFSREEALAYSQGVIGKALTGVTLTAPDGRPVALEDFRGKPLVISLIFTSCNHICPSTTVYLQQVVKKARSALDEDSFEVITVGFDTANDNPERMAEFGRINGVTEPHWQFLSGDAAAVESLVNQLGFIYTPTAGGFDHLIQSSIIDADGKVYRQVYGITFPTPQLIEPLKDLVFGEPREQSSLSYLGNRIRLFCTVYDPATDNYYIDISVFIGTFVGILSSLVLGWVLVREWRKSMRAGR
jgi:protein SCO1/2